MVSRRDGLKGRTQPTMADVAALAGVSTMTVSRALRESPLVSPEARLRILAAVDDLGYVLDRSAGTLSSKRSGFVAVVIPSINNSNFSDTAHGITDAVEAHGLQLLLGYSDYMVEKEERLIEAMLRRRPEGVILTGGRHTDRTRRLLVDAGVPVVETWDMPSDPIDHVVGFSNAEATRALVHRLAERGYRNIGFIGGTTDRDSRGADRRRGFSLAVEELGLARERIISFGTPPISIDQGAEAITLLVEQWPDVDAAVCVSDLSAFGAVMECQRRGWSVPQRIAVAGFGNFEVARCSNPRITTVAVDCHEIGRTAGELIVRAIDHRLKERAAGHETIIVPFRVIERETT
jgi:LacI family gluconate utilization system Gnt-I transcriptional repressor